MCEELSEKLKEANEHAEALCVHLYEMGANKCNIPITLDFGCFSVQVVKTF